MRRRVVRAAALVVLLVAAGGPVRARAQALEAKLKAAVVSKLPQFVEWPAPALAGRTAVDLCVAAPDPFGTDLADLVAGETLEGRPVAVRRVEHASDVDRCHLLFLPAGAGVDREFLARAASRPILTVGDDRRFLDEGGMVRLRTVDGRIRFDVNAAAAQAAGLHVSSQLLQLALTVRVSQP